MIPFPVSPTFPDAQILAALQAASGVQVLRSSRAEPMPGLKDDVEKAWIEYHVRSTVDIGWDERRLVLNTATVPPTQQAITIGRREATLNIDAWSLDGRLGVIDLLERVRFGFNRDVVLNLLRPNVAIRWCEKIVKIPAVRDGRTINMATMDLQISYVVAADTLDPAVDGFILSVGPVTGTGQS